MVSLLMSTLTVSLGKYHSASGPLNDNDSLSHSQSEEEVIEQILRHDKSAAGILCLLKTRHIIQASNLTLTKDVLGIVATLGKVHDENLSRSVFRAFPFPPFLDCFLYLVVSFVKKSKQPSFNICKLMCHGVLETTLLHNSSFATCPENKFQNIGSDHGS